MISAEDWNASSVVRIHAIVCIIISMKRMLGTERSGTRKLKESRGLGVHSAPLSTAGSTIDEIVTCPRLLPPYSAGHESKQIRIDCW